MRLLDRGATIGVLTPYTGGRYFGTLLAAIHRSARARGAQIVALHTVGMDLFRPEDPNAPPLAFDVADGWIAINELDSAKFAARVVAAGKPLIYLSERPTGIKCCSVLPENREGARVATRHLIEHGHKRIAFAGFLGQYDLRERYDGYMEAQLEAGIEPDPTLLYFSLNNLEIDGREVGRQLIAGKLPFTALVAGTDKTALGVISVMRQAGYQVPKDLAIVGFDDIDKAQYSDPPLSTVRQRFDLLGTTATDALLAHIHEGTPLPEVIRVPTVFIRRSSCGCAASATLALPTVNPTPHDRVKVLATTLLETAGTRSLGLVSAAAWPGARRIAEHVERLLHGPDELSEADLATVWEGFLEVGRDVESVEAVMALLEAFAKAWCPVGRPGEEADASAATERRLQTGLRHLRIGLMRNWRVGEQVRNRYYDFVAEANAKINVALVGKDFASAKTLSWLKWTRLRYGALGLWSPPSDAEPRRLRIVSEYGTEPIAKPLVDTLHDAAHFPPPTMRDLGRRLGDDNMLLVVPITGADGNRGLLSVIGPVEVELLDHNGSVHEWAALVGASLDRQDVEAQLRDHALRDALTGLPNRVYLIEQLERLIATARRTHRRFAVLFLDLDDFKSINDSLGHVAGDRLLVDIARRLKSCLRDSDMVARLGGDEFAILLADVIEDGDALDAVTRVHAALRAPFTLDGDRVFTSCSAGLVYSSGHHQGAPDLLRDADTAMHRAKLQGRARTVVFDSNMHAEAVERLRLDSRLRQALERSEFVLHYQPIFSLRANRPIGAEALIRWNHPEQGCLPPVKFLGVSEEVGLAIPISQWVIETACREAVSWQKVSGEPLYVNVNVPAQHFKDPQFVELIKSTLTRLNLPPAALGLELVESSLIDRRQDTIQVLADLRDLGVRTAIDDFGTGYSSLSYLKIFPLSVLKLDREFIQGVPEDPHDTAIASAIIAMAHGLGLTVVAEGVESAAQAKFLRAQGCDALQGFLLSRPLSAEDCRRYLAEGGDPDLVVQVTT